MAARMKMTITKATYTSVRDHLKKHQLAFLVGNGINRYKDKADERSWEKMLLELHRSHSSSPLKSFPNEGLSLTEFYDLLLLESRGTISKRELQKQFVSVLNKWKLANHHREIVACIRDLKAPLLTTNFDNLLPASIGARRFYTVGDRKKNFSAYYPWQCYYSDNQLVNTEGFAIWFLHGMSYYPQSIRLGLTDYLRAFSKVKDVLPRRSGRTETFPAQNTWLSHFMNKSLFILGLGLSEHETFLRWLLLQRAIHMKRRHGNLRKSWYVETSSKGCMDGKRFFLQKVGFEIIEVTDYKEVYEEFWHAIST